MYSLEDLSVADNDNSGVARIENLVSMCIPYFEENQQFQLEN